MIYGEIVQRWQLARGVVLKKWPHAESALLVSNLNPELVVFAI